MVAIVMTTAYPGTSLYSKSQLSLSSSSITKVYHLYSQCIPQIVLASHHHQLSFPISPFNFNHSTKLFVSACYSDQPASPSTRFNFNPSTKLFVSGLSFRTTEDSLRSAFNNFGELVEVNLMMDKIANRPRGFAFIRYATEEESQKAIEGMHGKFLDGRVIFVEVAKSRSELRRSRNHNSGQ